MISIKKAIEKLATVKANEPELLWTNPNPSASTFNPQTISLDLSGYSKVKIDFRQSYNSSDMMSPLFADIDNNKHREVFVSVGTSSGYYWQLAVRDATVTPTGIEFNDCVYSRQGSATGIVQNYLAIPYKIYGIK